MPGVKCCVFDTETTGLTLPSVSDLNKQPKIIELGVVVVEGGVVVATHNWLINPGELISAEITKITGITNQQLEGKPSFGQLLGEIEEVFAGTKFGIAHNAPFDRRLLELDLERIGRTGFPWPEEFICSVQEYQPVFGFRPKLKDLYERNCGKKLEQTHRASDDAMALYEALAADKFFHSIGAA